MPYHPPYQPHELDTHPDRGRIQATLDALCEAQDRDDRIANNDTIDELERELEDLEGRLHLRVAEIESLKEKIQKLETQSAEKV